MSNSIDWESVRRFYVGLKKLTKPKALKAAAKKFGISLRSVQRRVTDDWESDRNKIDDEPPLIATSKVIPIRQSDRSDRTQRETHGRSNAHFDEEQIIEDAIEGIGLALAALNYQNLSSAAGAAGALTKMIVLRRELFPRTPTDFLRAMEAEGIGPESLSKAAAEEWARQA